MAVRCTCKREVQGILYDHVAAHAVFVGDWRLEDLVHERDKLQYYRGQYPSNLPVYPVTSFNDLQSDATMYMPVVRSVRRGRPKKARFISPREDMMKKLKNKRKCKDIAGKISEDATTKQNASSKRSKNM